MTGSGVSPAGRYTRTGIPPQAASTTMSRTSAPSSPGPERTRVSVSWPARAWSTGTSCAAGPPMASRPSRTRPMSGSRREVAWELRSRAARGCGSPPGRARRDGGTPTRRGPPTAARAPPRPATASRPRRARTRRARRRTRTARRPRGRGSRTCRSGSSACAERYQRPRRAATVRRAARGSGRARRVLPVRLVAGEDPVQRAARLFEDLRGLGDLRLRAGLDDLHHGGADAEHERAELADVLVAAGLLPRGAELVGVLGDVRAAGVRELEEPAAGGLLGADESLVLELRERRVDRARARAPGAVAAGLDLLHQAVAVARLLGEQDEQGGADVTAAGAGAEASRSEGRTAEAAGAAPVSAAAAVRTTAVARHGEPQGSRVE